MRLFITGCAGFIGINFLELLVKNSYNIFGIDKLTYASNPNEIKKYLVHKKVIFKKLDINSKKVSEYINFFKPDVIINMAAESHVDNSILSPDAFIRTNINGTLNLLKSSFNYYSKIKKNNKKKFKFIQISTDEVYGSINSKSVNEKSFINPSSPYSASKASSDNLVQAWHKTYGLPTIITRCSNNFGPFQNKEKFIPKLINSIKNKSKFTLYGNGKNVREWIYVLDHCEALEKIIRKGKAGNIYNIGSGIRLTNIEVIKKTITKMKNRGLIDDKTLKKYYIKVSDRLGHDQRYAINSNKIKKELRFRSKYTFNKGLNKTIDWYLNEK